MTNIVERRMRQLLTCRCVYTGCLVLVQMHAIRTAAFIVLADQLALETFDVAVALLHTSLANPLVSPAKELAFYIVR